MKRENVGIGIIYTGATLAFATLAFYGFRESFGLGMMMICFYLIIVGVAIATT